MSNQRINQIASTIDSEFCLKKCSFCVPTTLFELCTHPKAEYKIGLIIDYHTCHYMLQENAPCGPSAQLLKPK